MFSSLKNKIKEETGSELPPHQRLNHNNNRIRNRGNSVGDGVDQITMLRSQCNDLSTKVTDLTARLLALQEEKSNVEKTNEILLETVKVAQTQKDLYCDEQEKIQNLQRSEIDKLKSLLSVREQEVVDRIATTQYNQELIETLSTEIETLKKFEHLVDDLQDELQSLRHSAEQEKNHFTTTLARVEEENRHLKKRLAIMEQSRIEVLGSLKSDEKIQALVQERKLLEQHLEEAHLQLSDIKSSWSGQNLALETQVSRLSKQVAEETTEKRKAIKLSDDLTEKVKQLDFEMLKLKEEINQRDDKIKLVEEEIDDLNAMLKECREENEQQVLFERNKSHTMEIEINMLKKRLEAGDIRFNEHVTNADGTAQALRQQVSQLQNQLSDIRNELEHEKEEKLSALLRNAEISQSEEILRKDLRVEREENNELNEKYTKLLEEAKMKDDQIIRSQQSIDELQSVISKHEDQIKELEEMRADIFEKNKTIRILNQNLTDLKKTIQTELLNSKSLDAHFKLEKTSENNGHLTVTGVRTACGNCSKNISSPSVIVMDEVNFKYLKHVIVKFLTSREVEARHLIRAVSTLLSLSKDEEKLLYDTLNWKMSWFGSKPNHGSGQHAYSIPPS